MTEPTAKGQSCDTLSPLNNGTGATQTDSTAGVPPNRLVLGRQTAHCHQYNPDQLCPIPRKAGREAAGVDASVLRHGEDIWNLYELSWLSPSGRPVIAVAEVRVPWSSPCLIESKSLKLYTTSFNMTPFPDAETVCQTMRDDLSRAAGTDVAVRLREPDSFASLAASEPKGLCLDNLPDPHPRHETNAPYVYQPDASLLRTDPESGSGVTQESVFSRLFRSRCPVTGQPDWATICVSYTGKRLHRDSLLRYLISFREHQAFHEACVERIYMDILCQCQPAELSVSARFTRRGGIDINPVRSTTCGNWDNTRDPRQ